MVEPTPRRGQKEARLLLHRGGSLVKVVDDGQTVTNAHRDEDLTFFLQVFHDLWQARSALVRVRRVYPKARVVLVSDGDGDPRYAALAARLGVEYRLGERLYAVQHGGQIVQRMLDVFLERPVGWLLRIDTDTRVHRRFRFLPQGTCVFGTLEHRTATHREPLDPPVVHGGCLGFTRAAAARLQASRVFLDPRLSDWRGTWATTTDARERATNGRVSFDHLVRWGCRELGLELREFAEVRSLWRTPVLNPGLRYAATHPHKPWWQWPRLWASLWLSRWRAQRSPAG